jgi:hypothetical protein
VGTVYYCAKGVSGRVYTEGSVPATRFDLDRWIKTLPGPCSAALKVAHPLMLRAIAAAKKKNDRIDAKKIFDCLRCDFLPECYRAATAVRERRRTLRYRNLQTFCMDTKIVQPPIFFRYADRVRLHLAPFQVFTVAIAGLWKSKRFLA